MRPALTLGFVGAVLAGIVASGVKRILSDKERAQPRILAKQIVLHQLEQSFHKHKGRSITELEEQRLELI